MKDLLTSSATKLAKLIRARELSSEEVVSAHIDQIKKVNPVINAMALPATQVPLGLNKKGLPLGVQLIGIHGNDHLTIAAANALEKIFGGWVPPEKWLT